MLLLIVGLATTASVVSATANLDGRWKLGGDNTCVFDPTDSGPDQCQPPAPPAGRWKLGGDGSCTFDSQDSGPDQCTPPAPSEAADVSTGAAQDVQQPADESDVQSIATQSGVVLLS